MRRLQHAQLGIAAEPAHGELQEAARGDVIGVEDGDKRSVEPLEGAVDVAGFSVGVVIARHVADAGFFRERTELFALSVVEDVDI